MGKAKSYKPGFRGLLSSPLLVSLGAAVLVVFALSLVGYIRRGGFWSPEVEAKVYSNEARRRLQSSDVSSGRIFAFQGEVYSDAERLREASALALAGMLLSARRDMDRQPIGSVEALLSILTSDGALPPGMVLEQGGTVVSSAYSTYYIRYRQAPLGVEVVSVGKGALSGPPFLVRLPDDEFSQNALTYYRAAKADGTVTVPGSFAPAAQVISLGWVPITYRANELSADEVEKSRQWLAGVK